MIRKAKEHEYDRMVSLWLVASIKAHDGVEPGFWRSQQQAMRQKYVPSAENWVYVRNDTILGFCSLQQNVVAALFVDPAYQHQGIGSLLLEYVKSIDAQLELSVYSMNAQAVAFYEQHGFRTMDERFDDMTGQWEKVMRLGEPVYR
ncbi:putative acetyltransferase [Pseudomonas duriflava]|uniref:Putative acetyltransferase n=1 Tax=Pseudomonas duriflava TaxID=459528 RepID=A0A562PXZ3_9PSED|nr:GNAT family N-acetyltransferase [Pseudomonas duriflava]TWI49305.1 putative acetyltransferase [Pseudomonas duriflava]